MLADLAERGKVDLDQHGNDHEPDQGRHRQIDVGDFHRADRMKYAWRQMAEDDAGDDAQRDPNGEIAFEQGHYGFLCGCNAPSVIVLTSCFTAVFRTRWKAEP